MSESNVSSAEREPAEVQDIDEDERMRRKRQRRRSLALGWALALLAILFFIVTIVRLGPMVANRPL